MRSELQEKVAMYHAVNGITLKGEIVVFGSTFMANFPFYELSKKYVMANAVYNRSIEGLTLPEAEAVLNECVLELRPSKIFLLLGENEPCTPSALAVYARIVKKIQAKLPSSHVFILSLPSQNDGDRCEFNEKLKRLAEQHGVKYLELSFNAPSHGMLYEKVFKRLHCFFRGDRLTFAEAFAIAD